MKCDDINVGDLYSQCMDTRHESTRELFRSGSSVLSYWSNTEGYSIETFVAFDIPTGISYYFDPISLTVVIDFTKVYGVEYVDKDVLGELEDLANVFDDGEAMDEDVQYYIKLIKQVVAASPH